LRNNPVGHENERIPAGKFRSGFGRGYFKGERTVTDSGLLGILLYGYDRNDALVIVNEYMEFLEEGIVLIGASCSDDLAVSEILSPGFRQCFEDHENKVIMFLGFSGEQVQMALKSFPGERGIPRPIFCGLTESNYNWKMKDLVEHLLEEQAFHQKRKGEAGDK
jgi:hypothetical protein